jgi:hypothetical protein
MSLSDLHNHILTPFVEHTIQHLASVGYEASASIGFEQQVDDFSCKGYALVSNTTGVIEGRLLVHHYPETATPLANKLLGRVDSDDEQLDDDGINALSEFCLAAIKPAIAQLDQSDVEIHFSPTYFIADTKQLGGILDGVKLMLTIPIEVRGLGRFYFNYLLNNDIAA